MTKQDKSNSKPHQKNLNLRPMPTSPHLQIYRWNISSITSILHRATGVLLFISLIIIAWFIVYYTYNTNLLEGGSENCSCWTTKLLKAAFVAAIFGMVFSLYYHFCNGIRHLFWDIGKGFELKTARKTGFLVLISAILLTVASFAATFYFKIF